MAIDKRASFRIIEVVIAMLVTFSVVILVINKASPADSLPKLDLEPMIDDLRSCDRDQECIEERIGKEWKGTFALTPPDIDKDVRTATYVFAGSPRNATPYTLTVWYWE